MGKSSTFMIMSKWKFICLFWGCFNSLLVIAQSDNLYNDQIVSKIYVDLPPDSLQFFLDNLINYRYTDARMIFDDGAQRDTVEHVGFRLRGNTSLNSAKKSFKISFNEFEPGREYQGVRKLNLRGEATDPTMIREKLFCHVWNRMGLPERRAAFCQLYINGEYRGLYTNLDEIDKRFLERNFVGNDGDLFKCTWPADLQYLGAGQQVYKDLLHDPAAGERAYRLVTNETTDDYSKLVALITALNAPGGPNYATQLHAILNVESVLKAFAIDVATGNWDDYFYNKNNYYLYFRPETGKFEFITFDTDNTFGIDWIGKDWGKRSAVNWSHSSEPRPLATKLLAVPAFKAQYIHYIDTLIQDIICLDNISPTIDAWHSLITPAVITDTYHSLDFGYTLLQFHQGFNQPLDGHTPYGIADFLQVRCDSTRQQIMGLVGQSSPVSSTYSDITLAPNPSTGTICLANLPNGQNMRIQIFAATGVLMLDSPLDARAERACLDLPKSAPGLYFYTVAGADFVKSGSFVRE